jgi:flavodoxin
MARVLVIYFTQSGQQKEILQSLMKAFVEAGDHIHYEELKPVQQYPFPWTGFQFFNAFPETFFQKPLPLEQHSSKIYEDYELVVLGYQPWFLTPSRPVSSFLQSDAGKKVLAGKNVVTILGCRNMWLGAQEKVKARLKEANANLVGHIALDDRSGNLVSLITILRWMFTGKKNPFLIFPAAGVSAKDVEHAAKYGEVIQAALKTNNFKNLQTQLVKSGAIYIRPSLVLMEKRGQRGFGLWSKFIAGGGAVDSASRKVRVYTFMYVLPTAIILLTPLLWILSKTMLLLLRKKLVQEIEYYKGVSLR